MKAKLASISLMTRIVVEDDATDEQILAACEGKFHDKITTELSENLEDIIDDVECPYGTFEGEGMPSDDDFFEKYDVQKNHIDDNAGYNESLYESFGKELEYVIAIAKEFPKRVWTYTEGDEGMYIVSGMHFVNRMGFFITKEDAEGEFEEYKCEEID